jgi:hypothetical protein
MQELCLSPWRLLGKALVRRLWPLLLLLVGCEKEPERCLAQNNHAVWKGSAESSSLSLSLGQTYAIAAVEDAGGGAVCSAVVVGEGLALTAAHCMEPVAIATGGAERPLRALVLRSVTHPSRDVRLLVFDAATDWVDSVTPLELQRDSVDDRLRGSIVTLAGFGHDEQQRSGVRLFADEPVTAVSVTLIDVDGAGLTGACLGDSGGPLLSAQATVLGVLSRGASSCHGVDHYSRLDNLVDWLDETIAEPELRACGEVTNTGTCMPGGAVWCEAGQFTGRVCRGKEVCTYVDDTGYRCVNAEASSCAGLGEQGQCEGDVAAWCGSDTIVRVDCASCGQVCARDGAERARCR